MRRRLIAGSLVLGSIAAVAVPFVSGLPGSSEAARKAVTTAVDTVRLAPAHDSVVKGLETGFLDVPDLGGGAHRVRVGVVEPTGPHIADVLFLHGHADRLDNHPALFDELAAGGIRVVSFDLPSHGLTDAGPIDVWSFDDLATLAARVERATRPDDDHVPFVLAGWSFGGLLATTISQSADDRAKFDRPLDGLALEVPALAPFSAAGGDGISRLRALTHDLNAPVAGPPSPASPFQDPVFASRLLLEAEIARARPLPAGLRTFVELSDPAEDLYVDVPPVKAWAEGEAKAAGADVTASICSGARHGIDFESYPVGASARSNLLRFVTAVADGDPTPIPPKGSSCR